MTHEFFNEQMKRLKLRFGEKAFDQEFILLIVREVFNMENADFLKLVDSMIGSRRPNQPPLLVDFREQRLLLEKNRFNANVNEASKGRAHPDRTLKEQLIRAGFPGCSSVREAVELALEKNRIQKAMEEK